MPTYAKKFRVMAITLRSNMKRRLVGIEYDEAVYRSGAGDQQLDHFVERMYWSGHVRTADEWATIDDIPHPGHAIEAVYAWDNTGELWSVGTDRILRKSLDDGEMFSSVGVAVPGSFAIGDMGKATGTILVVTRDTSDEKGGIVYKSTDTGATWTTVFTGGDTFYIRQKSLTYHIPSGVWLLISRNTPAQFGTGGADEILRSTDVGTTWSSVHSWPRDDNGHCDFLLTYAGTILAFSGHFANTPTFWVHRSTDGGATWAEVLTTSFGSQPASFIYRTRMAQWQSGARRVWLAGKWYSDNDGLTWVDSGNTAPGGLRSMAASKNAMWYLQEQLAPTPAGSLFKNSSESSFVFSFTGWNHAYGAVEMNTLQSPWRVLA